MTRTDAQVPAELFRRARELYDALHALAEPSGEEAATAALVADVVAGLGATVRTGIGGHGVVAVIDRGPGPVVWARAELDAVGHHSRPSGPGRAGTGAEHLCGHDLHLAAWWAAAAYVCERSWSGTLVLVAQPAEESLTGAQAMVADGLGSLVPEPDVLLAQHVAIMPSDMIATFPGQVTSAHVECTVVVPEGDRAEDFDAICPTAGAHTFWSVTEPGRTTLAARFTDVEAARRCLAHLRSWAGPRCVRSRLVPPLHNEASLAAAVAEGLRRGLPRHVVRDLGPMTSAEDLGDLSGAPPQRPAPVVYWLFGGIDPRRWSAAGGENFWETTRAFAPLHDPRVNLDVDQALRTAIGAMGSAIEHAFATLGSRAEAHNTLAGSAGPTERTRP